MRLRRIETNSFLHLSRMKRLIPTLVFLLCIKLGMAQIENDKVLHFVGGNLYGLAGAGIAKQISDGNRYWTFVGAVGGSLLIGLGKEAIDSQRTNGWDNDDLLATVLGGTTVGFTIDIFTDHKKRKRRRLASTTGRNFKVPLLDSQQQTPLVFAISSTGKIPTLAMLAMPRSLAQ